MGRGAGQEFSTCALRILLHLPCLVFGSTALACPALQAQMVKHAPLALLVLSRVTMEVMLVLFVLQTHIAHKAQKTRHSVRQTRTAQSDLQPARNVLPTPDISGPQDLQSLLALLLTSVLQVPRLKLLAVLIITALLAQPVLLPAKLVTKSISPHARQLDFQ